MKEQIIEIIGQGMEYERAELKATQVIILFNQSIVDALKESKTADITEFVEKIFIQL